MTRAELVYLFPGLSGADETPRLPFGRAKYGYRHLLHRWLTPIDSVGEPRVISFVMLNPSTADGQHDDSTVRRCKGFAEREAFDLLVIANLFDARATKPRELSAMFGDKCSSNADPAITCVAKVSGVVCLAWGGNGSKYPGRVEKVVSLLREHYHAPLMCLAETKGGDPGHPLYLPKSLRLSEWGGA